MPDFLNFARKEVVSETTQLKVCIGCCWGWGWLGKICRKVGRCVWWLLLRVGEDLLEVIDLT